MSVFSYIEVYKPGKESLRNNPHLGFGHGIGWFYQIAVAGGKRTYEGAKHSDDPTLHQLEATSAQSRYELPIAQAINNYRVISECLNALVKLGIKYGTKDSFYGEIKSFKAAQQWFKQAHREIPDGIVKLDWCEAAWGLTTEYLAWSDTPNKSFEFFVDLGHDCSDVLNEKMPYEDFAMKYPEYSRLNSKPLRLRGLPF